MRTIADLVQSIGGESALPRDLTNRELDLIAQSRDDFRKVRTMTSAQARISIADALACLGVPKSKG